MSDYKKGITEIDRFENSYYGYKNQLKNIEQNYIDKLALADTAISRVKTQVVDLEMVVSELLRSKYSDAREKARIYTLFDNIQREFDNYEQKSTSFVTKQTSRSIEETSPFKDSLASSNMSDRNTFLNIRDQAKDLIVEYKDALQKIMNQNTKIQTIVEDKQEIRMNEIKNEINREIFPESTKTYESNTIKNYTSTDKSQAQIGEIKFEKYSQINNLIEELNQKKEENLSRLNNIENRITTIRNSFKKEDLDNYASEDHRERRYTSNHSQERNYRSRDNLRTEENRRSLKDDVSPDYRSLRTQEPVERELFSSKSKRNYYDRREPVVQNFSTSGKKLSSQKNYSTQISDLSKPYSHTKKSGSKMAKGEIRQLDHEIEILSKLIDSAMLQQKYSSKT